MKENKDLGQNDKTNKTREIKGLTFRKNENFSEWYSELVQKAELADYAPIRGFMVIRPNAYAIWEKIQEYFNEILKKKGVRNAYFPLLIPESFFKKEAKHAQGFAPELAFIEGKEEGERLALRPTSETIMYDSYAKWIRSWRDLPLKINQWCNVLRWEVKQTKPFIRTREFLWQEGHCVFENEKDAKENMLEIIEEYRKMVEELLAIPVIVGKKSKAETFAGAKETMTIEALMPDGRALQCGTSHNLGQGFAKSFEIKFKGKDEKEHLPWQTSWGFSTRLIGALAMVHGDDKGFILPPRIAERKVVTIPIIFEDSKEKVMKKAHEINKKLEKFSPIFDEREYYSPGWKFSEWELRGIPLRIEIGPKDLEKKQDTLVRRDSGKKESVNDNKLLKRVEELLEDIQKSLLIKAREFLEKGIDHAKTLKELKEKLEMKKIVKVFMVDDQEIETQIKEETGGATSRIIVESEKEGICIKSGKKTKTVAYFAKGY